MLPGLLWLVAWDALADIDCLESDPKHRRQAMQNDRLKPFWQGAKLDEMLGLFSQGCFKKHSHVDLAADIKVFTSRFHYKIKREKGQNTLSKLKVCMVVQGHKMEEGSDYDDAFAPVPRSTAHCILMSLAAANDMQLHSMDITQAFIQACWAALPEKIATVYISPPPGYNEEPGTVYEVIKPLYGIPASARALHYTLAKWFKSRGFIQHGFKESIWIREADDNHQDTLIVSAHIDDMLCACASTPDLTAFKADFMSTFDCMDDGEVDEHLGCQIIRDWKTHSITINQTAYANRVLKAFGFDTAHPVKTPLEPGIRLTRRDCPAVIDPVLHRRYHQIVGCISYLVQMTRPDMAFAYAELSKFVAYPGVKHLQQAERCLQYLAGTADKGITYSDPGPATRNKLMAWVDSDFAADPDTRRSVTGYVCSMNNGPISWKAKRQTCTTLSSAEAEFVTASICGQEIIYL